MTEPIRVGVSACLLGQPVRYDGGHKLDRWIVQELGRFVTFVPVCPEVEAGLGVPREAMRLVGDPAAPRLVTVRTGRDLTERVLARPREGTPGGLNLVHAAEPPNVLLHTPAGRVPPPYDPLNPEDPHDPAASGAEPREHWSFWLDDEMLAEWDYDPRPPAIAG